VALARSSHVTWLVAAAVQALFGLIIYLERFHIA
jgi:hypothetical protein